MARWLNAGAALLASVLVIVLLAFAVDWSFEPGKPLRGVIWGVSALGLLGAFLVFVRPWLQRAETLEELALQVERQHAIDSDLVAALQFESAEAPQWGSPQLAGAVVSYVAEFSPNLDVFEGFTWKKLEQRAGLLAVLTLGLGLLAVFVPLHLKTFGQRMLFANLHYPTKTLIDQIEINETVVFPSDNASFASPHGESLTFRVTASGVLPSKGDLRLKSLSRDSVVELPLEKQGENTEEGTATYTAELPKLVDSLTWQVFMGDAWTEPRLVDLIPLPVVSVLLTPESPQYILEAGDENHRPREGAWQLAVVQNSNVNLALRCTNKELKSAWVTIEDKTWPLTGPPAGQEKSDNWAGELVGKVGASFTAGEAGVWTLPVQGTPLENIQAPVRYEIQVEDVDGLQLPKPLHGYISLKTDKPPRIGAAITFNRYLPTAKPLIEFGAADDYGLAKILVHMELVPANPAMDTPAPKPLVREIMLPQTGEPVTMLRERYQVELAKLTDFYASPIQPLFQKGDQLKITLEAFDYRGELPGESKVSEPLVITITDRIGLGADLNDTNRLSAKQINAIIQQELGIGASQ